MSTSLLWNSGNSKYRVLKREFLSPPPSHSSDDLLFFLRTIGRPFYTSLEHLLRANARMAPLVVSTSVIPLTHQKNFFDVDRFKSIEFVTILLLLYVFWPRGMWDLSSLTRDQTCMPCIGRWSPNLWTTREVPPPPPSPQNFSSYHGQDLSLICFRSLLFILGCPYEDQVPWIHQPLCEEL